VTDGVPSTPSRDGLFDVSGKVVLITGGSRGLGRAMAIGFAERGAKVVVASRKLAACEALASDIQRAGGDAFAVSCHVGQWDTLPDVVNIVVAHYGRLDVLINNAGMSPLADSLLDTSETLFDKVIAVNLKGPLRLSALAAEAMSNTGGGSIINISSLAALKPTPLTTVYSAAKAGLNALTQAAAQEFAVANIRVNAIVCGTFDTDIVAGFVGDPDLLPEIVKPVALQRVGRPEEVVGAALYLASAASSYMTGAFISLDGGVTP
jgi:NAD(P)-dependent dehydrogenase (short-subunit alcohol dehydrogenase family)